MFQFNSFTESEARIIGDEMHALAADLFPICRSITGEGVRETFRRIRDRIDLDIHEVPTGTPVFDWTVPREWNLKEAWLRNSRGETVLDARNSSLHVLNYSAPFSGKVPLSELRSHLFTVPEQPDVIPYRTSYYKENWGFCLSHQQSLKLEDGEYEVCIDTSLAEGHLTYGELLVPGSTADTVLICAHVCHPSLANDNLSGITVAVFMAQQLMTARPRHTFRFLFLPATIGAITWLARNENSLVDVRHGLVLTCVGDRSPFNYKKSRRGNAQIDRAFTHLLRSRTKGGNVLDFSPYGYDERQFCSPGFDLPVGCLMRAVHGTFPEYHTSADNLSFITAESLCESLQICLSAMHILEHDCRYINLSPKCEPQLGKRGLYRTIGGTSMNDENMAVLWVLNLSDGSNSLLDIAERANLPFRSISDAAQRLMEGGLLRLA